MMREDRAIGSVIWKISENSTRPGYRPGAAGRYTCSGRAAWVMLHCMKRREWQK